MRVGVIGAGSMGAILARHLATRGHQVSIANSRGPESLTAAAAAIGATPASVVDAAQAGELVLIATPPTPARLYDAGSPQCGMQRWRSTSAIEAIAPHDSQ